MDKSNDELEVTRRSAIKKGAAVASGLWVAPVVVTMASPAFASASGSPQPGCEPNCKFVVRLTRNQDNTYSCGSPPSTGGLCGIQGVSDCTTSSCGQILSAVGDPATGMVRVCFSCTIVNPSYCEECPDCSCSAPTADTSLNCYLFRSLCADNGLPQTLDMGFTCQC